MAGMKQLTLIKNQMGHVMTEKVASVAVRERRRAQRFAVDWSAIVRGKDASGSNFDETAHLKDVSPRGAFIWLDKPLKVGTNLKIWIRLPFDNERWMSYPAQVLRVEAGRRFGAALKFRRVRPEVEFTLPGRRPRTE
jgi:hypothetical protein